ncbi:hypothetical protein C8R45DRAFT_989643 [Mycena sanguinolenta]|nr:hypothetical protein C8R45DRAFT_989643 [Mycena sanguinolenta]
MVRFYSVLSVFLALLALPYFSTVPKFAFLEPCAVCFFSFSFFTVSPFLSAYVLQKFRHHILPRFTRWPCSLSNHPRRHAYVTIHLCLDGAESQIKMVERMQFSRGPVFHIL